MSTYITVKDPAEVPDYVCGRVGCDEAMPAGEVSPRMRLAGVRCPACGETMHPAPWARAVPRAA